MIPEKPRQFFPAFQLEFKRLGRVCRQEGVYSGFIKWGNGLVKNMKAYYQELRKCPVIDFQLRLSSDDLVSDEFGPQTDFAIKNVQEEKGEDYDDLEAKTLVRVKDVLLKKGNSGIQVLYPMTGCGCLKDNKIRFLVTLTITQRNPGIVKGRSYRIKDSEPEKVKNLLSLLVQKDGRKLEPQEIIDENGQKQTTSLLIIDNEKAFIEGSKKGSKEINTAQEALQKTNRTRSPKIELVFLEPELFEPFFPHSLPLWPRVELPSFKEEKREPTSYFYRQSPQANHAREERLPNFIRPSRELPVPIVRNNAKDKDHLRAQEKKRKVLSLQFESRRTNREVNHSQSEASRRIKISQTLKENINQAIKTELPLIISSQAFTAPKVQTEINTSPAVEDDLRLTATSFIEEHDFLQSTSLSAKEEIQLPQTDYLPLLEISQAEMNKQEFLNEPKNITLQQEEVVTQEVPSISALKIPLVKDLEVNQRKAPLVVTRLQEKHETEAETKSPKATWEKIVFISQDQSLAAEQEEDIISEEKIEISVEPPRVVIKLFSKTVIEIPVSQPPKKKKATEFLLDDFLIEPEKDSDSQAKKVIERIEEVKRQTPLVESPFLPISESPKTHERRLRQSVFNWQILIPKLRLEARKPSMDSNLVEVIRELITVPFPKTPVVNLYEQREGKFLSAFLFHSLSGIYVTSPKTNSLPQSQVIFDSRWLTKVVYEAKDSIPMITLEDGYFDIPKTDIILPFPTRKIIKADECQEVITLGELLELEETIWALQPKLDFQNFKFLFPFLNN